MLRNLRGEGSFATRRTAPVDDLVIEVKGVGDVRYPVTVAQAKELRNIARPAKYGQGEKTILDRRVRDTWEVPLSRVRIDQRRWNQTLHAALDAIRDDLGLPSASTLKAQLHSMLVYEPGQFFAPHQDAEKNDEMIASLIVMLPSRSTGGELVVEHRNESVRYAGSATSLTFIAFYADTRHEVLPVTTGYRVVLTYNLLLAGDVATRSGGSLPETAPELLRRHFTLAPLPRGAHDRQAMEPPDRLVVLLDHQYTERGLRWSHLKGDDAARVNALRRVAALADCEVALAQAEIHETRECYDHAPRGRRRGWDDWDDDDDFDPEPSTGGVEVGEVLDSAVTIAPATGETVQFDPDVDVAELAEVTPTVELAPYDSEYTGYMGNWGNTMDRWYRRAAIVIWPRSRAFAIRAKADPAGALDDLLSLVVTDEPSRSERADGAATLLRFWPDAVRHGDQHQLLPRAVRLAWELADEDTATRILEPFAIEALAPSDATALVALAEQHGLPWLQRALSSWLDARTARSSDIRAPWVASALPDLCANLRDNRESPAGLGTEAARALAARIGDWLINAVEEAARIATPSRRQLTLATMAVPTLAILRAARIVDDIELRDRIVAAVREPALPLVPMLVDVLGAATTLPPAERTTTGLDVIAQHCSNLLHATLAQPLRADDDWSITEFGTGTCCADCATLAAFLADPNNRQLTWPLAKPRRQHIHHRIDEAEVPATHHTVRQGSPHKLVIAKTSALHVRDAERRQVARESLAFVEQFLAMPA